MTSDMISKVKEYTNQLLFIGGGINSIEKAEKAFNAGADIVVVGNAVENDNSFLTELGVVKKRMNSK